MENKIAWLMVAALLLAGCAGYGAQPKQGTPEQQNGSVVHQNISPSIGNNASAVNEYNSSNGSMIGNETRQIYTNITPAPSNKIVAFHNNDSSLNVTIFGDPAGLVAGRNYTVEVNGSVFNQSTASFDFINFNGSETYHNYLTLSVNKSASDYFIQYRVFPAESGAVRPEFADVQLAEGHMHLSAPNSSFTFEIPDFIPSGNYTLQVSSEADTMLIYESPDAYYPAGGPEIILNSVIAYIPLTVLSSGQNYTVIWSNRTFPQFPVQTQIGNLSMGDCVSGCTPVTLFFFNGTNESFPLCNDGYRRLSMNWTDYDIVIANDLACADRTLPAVHLTLLRKEAGGSSS